MCFFQGMPWRCALFHHMFMCQARYLYLFVLKISNRADNSSCVQSCPLIEETADCLCHCQQSACTPGRYRPSAHVTFACCIAITALYVQHLLPSTPSLCQAPNPST